MARYNVRDLLGHFVRPKSLRGDMCPHKCCRNKRVHPENFPVILSRRMLRYSTDEELAQHSLRYKDNEKVQAQVYQEMDRRDDLAMRKRQSAKARKERAAARKIERQEYLDHEINRAEAATNGYMLNDKARRAGVSERSLFTGSEARAIRYASPELLRYWETNPRPSAGMLSSNPRVIRAARARSDIGRSGNYFGYAGY